MLVSKLVHGSLNTNQGCVQRSQNPCNFKKVHYFAFSVFRFAIQSFYCLYDRCTFKNISRLFGNSVNKTNAFNLKVNCKELRLFFLHHINTECTCDCLNKLILCTFYSIFVSIIILLSL